MRPTDLGVRALDDALMQPLARLSLWLDWAAVDGTLLPRTPGLSVDYRRRASAATIVASDGTTGPIAQALPAFSAIDWNGDSIREEQGLVMSSAEALRFVDGRASALAWPTSAFTLRYDWIHAGDGPLCSYNTDAASGAGWRFAVTSGAARFTHSNGSSSEYSEVAVSPGDRCSARAVRYDDGAVQLFLKINDASAIDGGRSSALAPAPTYAAGSKARLNEIGDASRGVQTVRCWQVFGGVWSESEVYTLAPREPRSAMLSSGVSFRSITTSQTVIPALPFTVYEVDTSAGDVTLTFGPMASWSERAVCVKKLAGPNTVYVRAMTGELIDTQNEHELLSRDESLTIASNGAIGRVL